jgi:heme-degrading monooxygenase HmoA
MIYLIVRHKVKDYEKWRPIYDGDAVNRKKYGQISEKVLQNLDNPNDITLLFEWHSKEKVQEFFQSQNLKAKMLASGVISQPEILYMSEAS